MANSPLTPISTAILVALGREDLHGYALMKAIREQSDSALRPGTGTLYAAIARLMDEGWVREVDRQQTDNRRGQTYGITAEGKQALRAETTRLLKVLQLAAAENLGPTGFGGDGGVI